MIDAFAVPCVENVPSVGAVALIEVFAIPCVENVSGVCAVALIEVFAIPGVEYVSSVCAVAMVNLGGINRSDHCKHRKDERNSFRNHISKILEVHKMVEFSCHIIVLLQK